MDTNVLIDVVGNDPVWADWSSARLEEADLAGQLVANDVVYAEFSLQYDSAEATNAALDSLGVSILATPREAFFLAGRAYRSYRSASGTRTGVLADFFIGAHAAVLGVPILTRDARRYRTYFSRLELIVPD